MARPWSDSSAAASGRTSVSARAVASEARCDQRLNWRARAAQPSPHQAAAAEVRRQFLLAPRLPTATQASRHLGGVPGGSHRIGAVTRGRTATARHPDRARAAPGSWRVTVHRRSRPLARVATAVSRPALWRSAAPSAASRMESAKFCSNRRTPLCQRAGCHGKAEVIIVHVIRPSGTLNRGLADCHSLVEPLPVMDFAEPGECSVARLDRWSQWSGWRGTCPVAARACSNS